MACLQEYWTRERLVTHITKSSPRCLSIYRLYSIRTSNDDLAIAEANALQCTKDLLATVTHRAHAALPVTRLLGPLLDVACAGGIDFLTLLKKPNPCATVMGGEWTLSEHYPAEV